MKLIVGGRGSGKTTALVEAASKNWQYIVCRNHSTAYSVAESARQSGKDIPFPLTYRELAAGQFAGKQIGGILIDDLEEFLAYLARGTRVVAATYTPREKTVRLSQRHLTNTPK